MNYSEGEPIVGVNSQPEYELPDVSLADNSSYPSQEFPSLPANLNDSLSSADNWISHEILEDYQVRGLYAGMPSLRLLDCLMFADPEKGFQREIDEQLDTLFKDLVNYPEVEDSNNVDTEVPDGGDLAPHQNTAIHTSQDEPFNYEEWMAI
ncbi:hypothetical protein FRC07_001821 [Ceratobasidium sp. 392]|nr:hypothetical protein FRC07_001821 [Ceratobasidium sp. 392]